MSIAWRCVIAAALGFGLAGGARQRSRGRGEPREPGALVDERRRRGLQPIALERQVRVRQRVIDHPGVAPVQHAEVMRGVGEVAQRLGAARESLQPGMGDAAVGACQRAHRVPAAAQPRNLYGIKRHTPPYPRV